MMYFPFADDDDGTNLPREREVSILMTMTTSSSPHKKSANLFRDNNMPLVVAIILFLFVGATSRRHHHPVVAHGFISSSSSPPPRSVRRSHPLTTTPFPQHPRHQKYNNILARSGVEIGISSILASSSSSLPSTTTTSISNRDDKNDNNALLTENEIIDKAMGYLAGCIRRQLDSTTTKSPLKTTITTTSGQNVECSAAENNNAILPYDDTKQYHDLNANNGEGSSCAPHDRIMIPYNLAKGRFVDLATSLRGEQLLENLFLPSTFPLHDHDNNNTTIISNSVNIYEDDGSQLHDVRIVKYAIVALQSLLIYGMQIGVVGSDESQAKMVRHLFRPGDDSIVASGSAINALKKGGGGGGGGGGDGADDVFLEKSYAPHWDAECIRLLKYRHNISPGKLVLKELKRKRTARGAFDLLVDMGVWTDHEDVALLRSGFPVRFTETEMQVAKEVAAKAKNKNGGGDDPDATLGLRKDLRHFKVYTIDGPSTFDIDDGISVEVLSDDDDKNFNKSLTIYDGNEERRRDRRLRYWIHIADVDRWAPRGSELLRVAERRGTSLYLPHMTLNVFPEM